MSKNIKSKKQQAREAAQERQARRVVGGIAIGLIVAALILVGVYYAFMS
ncbi:MAG: hypothetical protein MJZ54_06555 [Bacteroidaceae bacterium]|nr:hypothetical protein [Bacteroidaceae bacterium]